VTTVGRVVKFGTNLPCKTVIAQLQEAPHRSCGTNKSSFSLSAVNMTQELQKPLRISMAAHL
jgi:hypothetical protein